MPIEIEAKMKIADLDAIRRRLEELDAALLGRFLETNIFFDNSDHTLRATDQGLRLRSSRDLDRGTTKHVITHKGPRLMGVMKNRQETELTVNDRDAATALLNALGFATVVSFEKRRDSWQLDHCQVELDQLPYLGTFIEIEGPDEASVQLIREKLHLASEPLIKPGYISLLMEYLEQHHIASRTILIRP